MSWTPPDRPEWVRAANAGEIPFLSAEADLPLERDTLLAEARARLGLAADPSRGMTDFGCEGFPGDAIIEPLERVLDAIEREAELSLIGRWMMRRFVLRLLEVRLQLMAYVRSDPGVQEEAIERPLFVAGAPRSGTTILFELLASDPALRAPLGWELLRPAPPPDPDPEVRARDGRIALADRELVRPQTVASGLLSIHAYGGRQPKECLSAMSFAFLSEEFTARCHVPSYRAWLARQDMTPAYRMHRLVLQVLQRRTGRAAWILKSPVHQQTLPILFETYPDAEVAITHRDPLTVLASVTSLIATLRHAHSDRVDFGQIGAEHAEQYRRTFDDLVDWTELGSLPEDRIHHSRYARFLDDPIAVVRELYARFGRPLDEGRLAAFHASRPREGHGGHAYRFEDLGLDRDEQRARFARYQSRFEIPSEDRS